MYTERIACTFLMLNNVQEEESTAGRYTSLFHLTQGCQLQLEKLENGPFSESGWKSWNTIGFSPALAGKAGILFFDLIVIDCIIRRKTILSRNRIKEEKIFEYHVGQAFFHQVCSGLEVFPMLCQSGW